jgi:hypothetical protein
MEWLSQHLEQWGLVWFGLLFWGSIFGASLLYILQESFLISSSGYALGLVLGLLAKYRGWSWIS